MIELDFRPLFAILCIKSREDERTEQLGGWGRSYPVALLVLIKSHRVTIILITAANRGLNPGGCFTRGNWT